MCMLTAAPYRSHECFWFFKYHSHIQEPKCMARREYMGSLPCRKKICLWTIFLAMVSELTSVNCAFLCWGCKEEFLIPHRTIYILHFTEERCIYHGLIATCIFIKWTRLVTAPRSRNSWFKYPRSCPHASSQSTGGSEGWSQPPRITTVLTFNSRD